MSDRRDQTDDPIDSELRSWFKSRRTPAAPSTLRAFADDVGSGARPTVPVRRLAVGWRHATRGRLAAMGTSIAVVVLAGGLLLVAGQRGPAAPTASPLTSQPAMASPHSTGSPAIATPIDDGGIFGASGLWAVAGGRLYLSSDFGATWVQRTLVPSVALDATSGDVLSSVFVLDADHAWTASPGSGSTVPYGGQGPGYDHLYVVISRTTDGGVSWQSVTIPGDWGGTQPVLAFADAEHGFLLLSGLRGGGGSVVFATTDGGANWQRVGGADSLGSVFSASDATTLWAGNEGDAGPVSRPLVDVSRDGGRTWTDARLPGLVGDIFVNDNPVAPPVFSGQDGAVAVIAASTDTSPMVRFYRSSDGGRTWVLAAQVHIGESGSTGVAVVDALHYVVIDSHTGQLQATSDGGVTWQPATSSGLSAAMRLRFWDARNGVAIVQTTNGPAPAAGVLRTADGGQTWSPVVITAPSSTVPSPDVTARYPDGIPSTFLGQHVYRPGDLGKTVPTGPFLLGGWDAGTVVSACIPMIEGASNPPCPSFEALAETRGGPMVIAVRWGSFPVPGAPALVLRVTAEPAPTCVSIPPGGCPGASVTVQDLLWAGDPSASTPSSTPIPTVPIPTQPPAQVTSTWTKVTLPTIVTQPITVGGPGGGPSALPGGGFIDFVPAAADRTVVLTSPDGSAWTQVGEITGQDALGVTGPVAFNGHVYVALGGEGGGGFYGMQSNGAAWVSTDLAHWTKAPAQAGLAGAIFHGVAAGSANFVAIGDSEGGGPTVWTSPDGLHWGPVLVKSVFPFDLSEATGIAQTTNGLVIVGRIGEEGATWTSPDGRTWTVHSPLPSGSGSFDGLAEGPAGFVSLVGAPSGGIEVAPGDFRAPVTPWTSTDGVTWHAGPSSPALFGTSASIVGVPGGYLAVGTIGLDVTEHLWSSTDGTSWVPVAGVDVGSDSTLTLVSDGHHVLLWISGPNGLEVLVSDGVHG